MGEFCSLKHDQTGSIVTTTKDPEASPSATTIELLSRGYGGVESAPGLFSVRILCRPRESESFIVLESPASVTCVQIVV